MFRELFQSKFKPEILSEAEFKQENLEKVLRLYKSLFSKKLGGTFYVLGKEEFKRQDGSKGEGYRLINEKGHQLRFNWDRAQRKNLQKENQKDAIWISSLDYWDPMDNNFDCPTSTVRFLKNTNVVEIWKGISNLLFKNIKGKFTIADVLKLNEEFCEIMNVTPLSEEELKELKEAEASRFEKEQFLIARGFKKTNAKGSDRFDAFIRDNNLEDEWDEYLLEISKGKPETNTISKEIKSAEKDLESQVYADPEYIFEDIENMVEFIAKGGSRSLILCGQGGIGKTFHVTKQLEKTLGEVGFKWNYHSGMKTTPLSFYKTCFLERKSCIVFDEADSALKNDDIVMMLKPALDTSGSNTMEYSAGTESMIGKTKNEIKDYSDYVDGEIADGAIVTVGKPKAGEVKLPSKFFFEGQMIFISNMRPSEIEDAIKSRSIYIDVYLSATDMNNRIKTILARKIGKSDTEEIMNELYKATGTSFGKEEKVAYMTPELARKIKPITVRTGIIASAMKKAGIPNWQRLASLYA